MNISEHEFSQTTKFFWKLLYPLPVHKLHMLSKHNLVNTTGIELLQLNGNTIQSAILLHKYTDIFMVKIDKIAI